MYTLIPNPIPRVIPGAILIPRAIPRLILIQCNPAHPAPASFLELGPMADVAATAIECAWKRSRMNSFLQEVEGRGGMRWGRVGWNRVGRG